ncbi:MAG: serine hydrolase, partial [Flavisolibacter sp.]
MTPTEELKKAKEPVSNSALLTDILKQYPDYFDSLLKTNETWQIKIIYTQVDRRANNKPVFKNYYFNIDPKQYFYPASTVKMPTAIMALQCLNQLKVTGLDKNTTMITDSAYSRQDAV